MNIAILGGAFDPIHYGHLLVAQQILDFVDIDEVWLMPCYSHPFEKKMTAPEKRLLMMKKIAIKKIKVSDWEIKQKKTNYTIDTLIDLSRKYPEHSFSFVIGSENVKDFKKWKDWQTILANFTVWVFPRNSFENKIKLLRGMKLIKNDFLIMSDLSSTKIRERARNGMNLDFFTPIKVAEYIEKNKVY